MECCICNKGGCELQRKLVASERMRPLQPDVSGVRIFAGGSKVEGFYEGCWWPGFVWSFDGLHRGVVYHVITEFWEGTMEFAETELRSSLVWKDGKWLPSPYRMNRYLPFEMKAHKRAPKV